MALRIPTPGADVNSWASMLVVFAVKCPEYSRDRNMYAVSALRRQVAIDTHAVCTVNSEKSSANTEAQHSWLTCRIRLTARGRASAGS